jgi:prevent-host-death family protein
MRQANVYEAKARLSELVQAALAGEEVWIARAGKPLVRLMPGSPQASLRGRGSLSITSSDLDPAFNAALDQQAAALFSADLPA